MVNNSDFVTIGELIKGKREDLGISLSEVSRKTGISKGVISKIESGETKSPELRTLKPIADVLNIPYEQIIEHCIKVEYRYGIYDDFLSEAIEISNPSLINKVATKFLENIRKETYSSLEQLDKLADTSINNDVKVALYSTIVTYARQHGIPHYIAKGLYQKYLIEREDLKRLGESFRIGEEIAHYVDFLSHEEKITYYYRMTLHAYNIKKYVECIEIGKKGFKIDQANHELKQRATFVVINSYILLNRFEKAEEMLYSSEKSNYIFVIDRSKFIRANIYFGKGEYNKAIPILRECLTEATEDTRIHIMNDLLESYINLEDMNSAQKFLEAEEPLLCFNVTTPHKHRELGRFFKLKGIWQVKVGEFDYAIQSYLRSIFFYEQISANEEISRCVGEILSLHFEIQQSIELSLLEKLVNVYNNLNKLYKGKVVIQ